MSEQRSALAGRTVLVTGAEGRIGSATCEHLTSLGASVTALSLPEEGRTAVEHAADRVLHGDTRDDETVQQALEGIELVVHLAAIPAPHLADWTKVFSTNVVSTFTVLAHAGERGIRRAVIASSINAYGGPFNSHDVLPAYYPLDERLPADLDDPYSLSKFTDERTAEMAARHWGTDIIALRFPLTASHEELVERTRDLDLRHGALEAWAHLDARDAARAIELSLLSQATGAHAVFVAADTTSVPYPTEDLLERYAPGVPRLRRFVDREVPIDLTRARTLLGFRAEHPLDPSTRSGRVSPLPD
ncbi:NAD-dependent epimerase/dehydratase family protein [uncultured Friedmanniella sp.]|uniref:NAD-dependent epimerase/dehydratase family protein n=1 Tax=uncultured Friedmanniella sp. TaxID=335381 RepID=UPI0035CA1872